MKLFLGNMFSEYLSCVDAWQYLFDNVGNCQANTLRVAKEARRGPRFSQWFRKEASAVQVQGKLNK